MLGHAQPSRYREGSLDADRPQPIYAKDAQDPWNRVFYHLFTRAVKLRLAGDFAAGAPLHSLTDPAIVPGFPELKVSDQTFERFESGDRAIDPLYPSFLSARGVRQLFTGPRYSEFKIALEAALDEPRARTPIARALMQSDLWATYDIIFQNLRRVDRTQAVLILEMLARMIRKVALTPEEIAALPDNYAAGMRRLRLPDVFGPQGLWIEVEWEPGRLHDSSADYRRSTRVFLIPGPGVSDIRSFLEAFRRDHSARAPLKAVALVTQSLLIDSSGNLAPSRITTDVQVRQFLRGGDGRLSKTEISEFELSRRAMLNDQASGGFVNFGEASPAYLATAGNDYDFASGLDSFEGRGRELPVLASMRARCAGCHGPDVGNLLTFSRHEPLSGEIRILNKAMSEHTEYVVAQKKSLDSWRSLREYWLRN
jgi:hypothetical protein